MKKFILPIIIAASTLVSATAQAQISINFRIGTPVVTRCLPPPQPVAVYDDYYYLPEVEAYYSVPEHCYYYMDGGRRWVSAAYLPGRYHDYDWRSARRYQVRAVRPFEQHSVYRNRFGGNWGGNWNNDRTYAYRDRYNDRRDNNRGYDRRPSDSPYDSNNPWSRDNGRFNDNRVSPYDGRRGGNDRQQGGNWQDQQPQQQNGGGNQWGDRNGRGRSNSNYPQDRGNDQRNNNDQYRNAPRDGRMQMANVQRVSF